MFHGWISPGACCCWCAEMGNREIFLRNRLPRLKLQARKLQYVIREQGEEGFGYPGGMFTGNLLGKFKGLSWMSITKEKKQELIGDFKRSDDDTGSPDVQIAVLSHRISELTQHLKTHGKDFASRRGLLMLVSRRRRLLDYVRRIDPPRYASLIERLNLRK